ncbi:hypothetical protein CPB84DRAFT_124313 [Gymnopilus junonius]|uniref:Uncharacterized protein n=1 Tax=Gymnopilus junonius TaxID=109634 RepID=A0A9P5NIP2_GYMJU|nr:hypothetical protein CPB84DRAFT_124313 [Gymnopilus junonius]
MPWDEFIALQFELVNSSTTDDCEYSGPFNTLMLNLFPPASHYQVVPLPKRLHDSNEFSLFYIIKKGTTPIFFLQVKTAVAINCPALRKEADEQMRDMFLEFASSCLAIPRLYGVSAMGTRVSVYEYTPSNRRLTPPRILPQLDVVTDVAPSERWQYDIMEPQGEAKLKELVAEIKEIANKSDWN